jgi:hypothetical protein
MDNIYGTPAGGESYPAATPDPSGSARGQRWHRWGACAAVAGFLLGGGITLAAVSGGGNAGANAAASTASGAASGAASGTQAAALNSALSAAAGSPAVPAARVRWALGRLRRLGGVEGTVTFHNKTGFHTLSFERGTIQSVSGSDVVIKSPDGTTWTWQIVSDTVVRKNGSKTTTSALSAGETAFAGGPVVSGARDARLIVIRSASPSGGPSGSSVSPGPSGSESAQTSLKRHSDACCGAPGPGAPRHAANPPACALRHNEM